MPIRINVIYRIISTIGKHILCMDATIIDQAIRIDKPAPPRVIVPALQIVQPRFRVVDVSAVAQGVLFAEGGGHRAGGGQQIAPCIVGVARGDGSLRRFRQAVVLIVGIARGVRRAVERLLLRGEVIVVVIAPRDAVCIPAAALLPAHQPILKIVEILCFASARAVCQQAEVAVVAIVRAGLPVSPGVPYELRKITTRNKLLSRPQPFFCLCFFSIQR